MKALITIALLLLTTGTFAHGSAPTWIEDGLYGGAKMNVVVTVVVVILAGIGFWLWRQEKRITRMEQQIEKER